MSRFWFALIFLFTLIPATAQTFRGGIAGLIFDPTGKIVSTATIAVKHQQTGFVRQAVSSATGAFLFPELPLGSYAVTFEKTGFATKTLTGVEVAVSSVTDLRVALSLAPQTTALEVESDTARLEASTSANTFVVGSRQVENLPLNGRDFLRLLRLAPGVSLVGTAFYSVNGNRGRHNNFQIDGADNNDAWQNASAGNQGGVSSIPNTLVPIEALDQFAIQTQSSAESGRNSGSAINLVMKSGTNQLHGSVFYFNRNEALARNSPVAPPNSSKRKIRTQQYGFSLGGPVIRNRTFYFATYEGQRLRLGNALVATTLNEGWLTQSRGVLSRFGVPENAVSRNLLSLWPGSTAPGTASVNNLFSNADNDFVTDNGVVKVDHVWNARHMLSARWFGGSGQQAAFSGSPYTEYFQVATSRLQNFAFTVNSALAPRFTNNLVVGVNYFNPTFNDRDRSANPVSLGLNTGVTDPGLFGAPTITISGFAGVGPTQPQGRVDTTWHVANSSTYLHGAHQIKFGGEFRAARLDVFNQINKRGTFAFDGSRGPWSSDATLSPAQRALADFVAGFVTGNNGARIARGTLARDLRQNSGDLFVHDFWQASRRWSVNAGLRYTYVEPIGDTRDSLTTFLPSRGIVQVGDNLPRLYRPDRNNFAPRVGFAFLPRPEGRLVVRGSYGIYYDVPQVTYFVSNGIGNGAAPGVNANPGGRDPVLNVVRNAFTLMPNESIFGTATATPPFGAYSIDQNFRLPFSHNYSLGVQYALGARAVWQVAYVGSLGRRLPLTRNINAPLPGVPGTTQERRPYNTQFPQLGSINEVQSVGASAYNSLQTSLTLRSWHGVVGSVAYTYSRVIDNGSEARFVLPANSYNLRGERGRAEFDMKHAFSAGLSYTVPNFWRGASSALSRGLFTGWDLHTFLVANSGLPFDLRAGVNRSQSLDGNDRVDAVGSPFSDITQPAGSQFRRFFRADAFALPALGSFGNLGRNSFSGPGFAAVDFSIVKNLPIGERVKLQFRVETFNLFNRTNWANPGNNLSASPTFGLLTNTRNGGGAPGIGPGEPRNVQLALRILF